MKVASIFPGQASQYVGMGKDIYHQYGTCRKIFDRASEIMEMDIKRICFEGPEETLKQTNITQPAIFIHSIAVFQLLSEEGFVPDGVAGHSLGEYSALVACGSLTFEDGLKLVKKRGELMHQAGQEKSGTMAAIIGMTAEQVYGVTNSVKGVVQPANFNSPGQVAISGEIEAVKEAMEKAKEAGAKKVQELVVSGAFHSPLMMDAQDGLKMALEKTEFKDAQCPLYSNVEGKPVRKAEKIRELLVKQLTMPVLWQNIITEMIQDNYKDFKEIGPGKVLRGLLKRIDRSAHCIEIGTVEAIANFLS
jgi:[acyl-carrier-protein] S-malonyltransferase